MADSVVGAPGQASAFGTPAMGIRKDRPGTDAQYNQQIGRHQFDFIGSLRADGEGGKCTARITANFSADSTGTDVWALQGSGLLDVQTLNTGSATAGSFTLGFTGLGGTVYTTANIPWNATADQVRVYLEALPAIGVGNVVVTGGPLPGTAVVIKFIGALAGYQTLMTLTASVTGTWSSPITHTVLGFANQQSLTAASGTSGGLLTLSFTWAPPGLAPYTVTTGTIAYNATAAVVVAAINAAMANIPGNSTSSGFCVATSIGGTNGPLQTNAVTLSFAGSIGSVSLNADQLALGYDEGLNPSGTMTVVATNARVIKLRKLSVTLVATADSTGLLKLVRAAAAATPYAPAGAVLATTNVKNGIFDPLDPAPACVVQYITTHPTSAATATDVLINEEVGSQAIDLYPVGRLEWNFENGIAAKLPRVQGWSDVLILNLAANLTGSGSIETVEADITYEPFTV